MPAKELIATNEGESKIPPHPEGQFEARCIDIIDRGIVKTVYAGVEKARHKVTFRFYCGETFRDEETGEERPLWVDHWVTLSMHEKAAMRKFIGDWRGKPVSDAEASKYNIMQHLTQPALIQVVHREGNARTYANLSSIMKLKNADGAPDAPSGYVCVNDRPPRDEDHGSATKRRGPLDADDDDLPF